MASERIARLRHRVWNNYLLTAKAAPFEPPNEGGVVWPCSVSRRIGAGMELS
jgi:hypothetical protein